MKDNTYKDLKFMQHQPSRSLNILVVQEINWLKKPQLHWHHLFEGLSQRGHLVVVIDYDDYWKREHNLDIVTPFLTTYSNVSRVYKGSKVTLIRPGILKIKGLSRISAIVTHTVVLRQLIKNHNFDRIVLCSIGTNAISTLLWAKYYGVPVIFYSIDIIHLEVPPFLRAIAYNFEKYIYRRVDKIITLTQELSEYVTQCGANAEKITFVPPGVDIDIFNPSIDGKDIQVKYGLSDKDHVILYMGQKSRNSGLEQVIRQMPIVINKVPDTKFIIVGPDRVYENETEHIKYLIRELGLEDYIFVVGKQPYNLLPKFVAISNVCINPFIKNEFTKHCFPKKVLEYMAGGRPVITTDLPGTKNILTGDCGVIFIQDPSNLWQQIVFLLQNKKIADNMGKMARRFVMENYSMEEVINTFESEIDKYSRK